MARISHTRSAWFAPSWLRLLIRRRPQSWQEDHLISVSSAWECDTPLSTFEGQVFSVLRVQFHSNFRHRMQPQIQSVSLYLHWEGNMMLFPLNTYETGKSLYLYRRERKREDEYNIKGDMIRAERMEIPKRNILREWWRAAPNTELEGVAVPHQDSSTFLASAQHPPLRRPPETRDIIANFTGVRLGGLHVVIKTYISY